MLSETPSTLHAESILVVHVLGHIGNTSGWHCGRVQGYSVRKLRQQYQLGLSVPATHIRGGVSYLTTAATTAAAATATAATTATAITATTATAATVKNSC